MDNGRNYIIDRLKSKKMSIDEFNYETLTAPPLAMFLNPYDIWQLNGIAKSIRLAGNPKEKLRLINEICRSKGLVKFGAGTNRVIYRHPEFNNIVFKIAYDSVGLQDNPAEFRNQHLLKPFVAKTFEISPCGTVAISERVEPVRSREEFLSIADDIYTLLNEFVIGKYIMEDIGSEFFLNFGLRKGFGIVILDYAFLYELDGNKIYCNKPDPMSQTGLCEGEICYDDGFNHLFCNKCGAQYRAIELQKKIKDNEIIVKREGEQKMIIKVKGGSTNANKIVNNGVANENFQPTVGAIVRSNKPKENQAQTRKVKVNITPKVEAPKRPNVAVNVTKPATKPVEVVDEEIKTVNGVVVEAPKTEPTVEKSMSMEEFVASMNENEEKYLEKITEEIDNSEAKLVEVKFDDVKDAFALVSEPVEAIEVPTKSPVEIIDDAVNAIIENLQAIKIDVVKEDAISRMIDKIVQNIPANGPAFKNVIEIAMSIYDNAEDDAYIDVIHSAKFIKLVDRAFTPIVKFDTIYVDSNIVEYEIDMAYAYDHDDVAFVLSKQTVVDPDIFFIENGPNKNEEAAETEEISEEAVGYSGMQFSNAVVVNANSIFPDAEKQEIIVGIDENGDYVTNKDNNIVAFNVINDCEVDSVALVAKEWIQSIDAILNEEENSEESDEIVEAEPAEE